METASAVTLPPFANLMSRASTVSELSRDDHPNSGSEGETASPEKSTYSSSSVPPPVQPAGNPPMMQSATVQYNSDFERSLGEKGINPVRSPPADRRAFTPETNAQEPPHRSMSDHESRRQESHPAGPASESNPHSGSEFKKTDPKNDPTPPSSERSQPFRQSAAHVSVDAQSNESHQDPVKRQNEEQAQQPERPQQAMPEQGEQSLQGSEMPAPQELPDQQSQVHQSPVQQQQQQQHYNAQPQQVVMQQAPQAQQAQQTQQTQQPQQIQPPLQAHQPHNGYSHDNDIHKHNSSEPATHIGSAASDPKIGSTVPGDGHECANCKATQTPLWRRGPNGQVLCNACGLYIKARNIHRPLTLKRSPNTKKVPIKNAIGSCPGNGRCNGTGGAQSCNQCPSFLNNNRRNKADNGAKTDDVKMISCQNCGTVNTPLWRRDVQGHVICNACGLYNRMHKDGRPALLQTAIVKRRKRNRPRSDEANDTSNSAGSANSDNSRPSSSNSTPQLSSVVPSQPYQAVSLGASSANLPNIPPLAANAQQQQQQMQHQHQQHQQQSNEHEHQHHHDHAPSSSRSDDEKGPAGRLCCSHLNPGIMSATPEYQQPPTTSSYGFPAGPGTVPQPHNPYGYMPLPGMAIPGLHPGSHFALGHLPPPIAQLPYNPYGHHQIAQLAPQSQPAQPVQQPPVAPTQQASPAPTAPATVPAPASAKAPNSVPAPHSAVLQETPKLDTHPLTAKQPTLPTPKYNDNNMDQTDSPLAVLQYLKEASQDTKKEYLLAAQRQLLDKVAQYKSRLEAAEYQLSMCDSALKAINFEQK